VLPDLDDWDPWPPSVLAQRLAGLPVPWYVAGGWAVDLYLGGPTRPHEDLEIAVPAARFSELVPRFPDCDFYVAGDGQLFTPSPTAFAAHHQTWALERVAGRWRFDVFREPHDGHTWICRRDGDIRRPYQEIIEYDAAGVPYLAPEIVLLFKAKGNRDKDRADLRAVLPLLPTERRSWLCDAVERVHPGHPWLDLI
jgi:hypothetical protein